MKQFNIPGETPSPATGIDKREKRKMLFMLVGLVMVVVLLSAIYPARVAGQICTPGIERRWVPPSVEGDRLRMVLPFTLVSKDAYGMGAFLAEFWASHREQSIGAGFYVEDLSISREINTLRLNTKTWLAPFDQGVTQQVDLEMSPDESTGYYQIEIELHRTSGDYETWRRVCRTFLDDVRKQFLVWRTLAQKDRDHYVDELETLIQAPPDLFSDAGSRDTGDGKGS